MQHQFRPAEKVLSERRCATRKLNQTLTWRVMGVMLASLASVFAVNAPAVAQQQAQPQITCPVDWYGKIVLLNGEGAGRLEREIYGLKLKDWKSEHLDLALRIHDECEKKSSEMQSIKDANRVQLLADIRNRFKRYIEANELNAANQARVQANQARAEVSKAVVAKAGSSRIAIQPDGLLTFDTKERGGSYGSTCVNLEQSNEAWLGLAPAVQADLPRFYEACAQAGQLTSDQSTRFRDRLDKLTKDRQAQAQFIAAVQSLGRNPQQQTEKSIKALEDQWRFDGTGDFAAKDAAKALEEMRESLAVKQCEQHAKSAGVPAKFVSAWYLMEWNSPALFSRIPCNAAQNGVKFKFGTAGLFNKDNFEIRGKSTLRVWVESQAMPTDGTTQLLVPTKFELNGSTFEVSRGNIQLLARHIRTLLANE